MSRFVFIILDGVGVGALPDAADYGDTGSDTLGNLSRTVDLRLPFLRQLGLGNIAPVLGVPPVDMPLCLPGRLATLSAGKDTTIGHWEHMGLVTTQPFPTYPEGFPEAVLGPFAERIGRRPLGNRPASGTAIIAELGAEHLATGRPIVYTSADSVFQVAAHVDVVPLEQLYAWCQIARDLLVGPHAVARVIARPFAGREGAFVRTKDRRDFSVAPTGATYLDVLHDAGVPVLALGKISEVFAGRGVATKIKVASNDENLALLTDLLRGRSLRADFSEGLLFTNLVDFDMLWGHRNDVDGFARGLEAVDAALPEIVAALAPDDRLIVTADHGVDPTTPSTDHSREYVPLLFFPRPAGAPAAVYEGTLADTGATVYEYLTGADPPLGGDVIGRLRPKGGWRRNTPVQPSPAGSGCDLPGRVGAEEAADAARWLREFLGIAPEVVIVLGSGLASALALPAGTEVPYRDVPHWVAGQVPGHPERLVVTRRNGRRIALLEGRVHGYEGFDLSELQLQIRSMAAWGVGKLVITSACGAVAGGLVPGNVMMVREVLDLQHPRPGGGPVRLPGGETKLLEAVLLGNPERPGLSSGVHASVPGPNYETAAELAVLQDMGAATVNMSVAAEVRAAHEEGLEVAVLVVVANAGETTHEEVLSATGRAGEAFASALDAILLTWGPSESVGGTP